MRWRAARTRVLVTAPPVLAVTALLLTGCGGGSSGSSTTPTASGGSAIQGYGTESTRAARSQAATALRAYLGARAAKDWAKACAHLAAPTKQQVIAQAKGASGKAPHGCAAALAALNATNPGAVLRQQAQIGKVLSLRVDGANGYLLFFGAPNRTFYMSPMRREGGRWKVAAPAPNAPPI